MNWLVAGIGAVILPIVLLVGGAFQPAVLVVDVTIEEGPRIVAPLPFAVARAGLAMAPQRARRIDAPDLAQHLHDVVKIADALREAPDGVFVEIQDRGEHVVVSKRGDALHVVVVDSDRSRVEATVPLAAVAALEEGYDVESGTLRTTALLSALRTASRGPLLHVVDGGTEVRVRTW